jgi:UDP:flavonoid glycosyltransferase YjiC (YdhE family)
VPIVAAGDTQDKVETAARVGWSGVGINLRTGHPTPDAIRRAVRAVLTDPSYRLAAERIADESASLPGAVGFVTAVDSLTGRVEP